MEISAWYRLFGFVLWTSILVANLLLGSERLFDAILGLNNNQNETLWVQYTLAGLELLSGFAVAVSSRYSPDARKTEHRSLASRYFEFIGDLELEESISNMTQSRLAGDMSSAKIKRVSGFVKRYKNLLKLSFDSTNYALFLTQAEKKLILTKKQSEDRIKAKKQRRPRHGLSLTDRFRHSLGFELSPVSENPKQ